jgi:CO dehydrogenase maturation factor
MTVTIALAGKGGVGKTTISMLIVKFLSLYKEGTILAVDADPSSNLHIALGLDLEWTVGDIREDLLGQVKNTLLAGGAAMGTLPGGSSKREYLDYHVRSSLVESDRFDLIAMGKTEGPGCYCAVNHNLRQVLDSISKNYSYVVIDNEAGLEHLSRRTTRDVQHLFIVTDPTLRGLKTVERIAQIKNDLEIDIENTYTIMNRLNGELSPALIHEVNRIGVPLVASIPEDPDLEQLEINGLPLFDLSTESISFQRVRSLLEGLL